MYRERKFILVFIIISNQRAHNLTVLCSLFVKFYTIVPIQATIDLLPNDKCCI